jgi:hypothetical protein
MLVMKSKLVQDSLGSALSHGPDDGDDLHRVMKTPASHTQRWHVCLPNSTITAKGVDRRKYLGINR